MHSTDKPKPESRQRILAATLAAVRQRRKRRDRKNVVGLLVLGVGSCIFAVWREKDPDADVLDITRHVTAAPEVHAPTTTPAPRPLIERIPSHPLGSIVRVDSVPTTIERIGNDPSKSSFIERVNDQQLLASLPADQAAGIVRFPDGSVRFFLLK